MRYRYYIATFKNGKIVFARYFNQEESEILAKSIMIQKGFTREIDSVSEMSYKYYQLHFNVYNDADYVA